MEQIVADRRNKARNGGTLGSAKRMNGMDQLLSRGQFVLPLMRDNNNSDDVIQRPHKRSRVDEKENVCNGSGGDVANDVSTDDATTTIEHVNDEATIGRVDDEATRVDDEATIGRVDDEATRVDDEATIGRVDDEATRVDDEATIGRVDDEATRVDDEATIGRVDDEATRIDDEATIGRVDDEATRIDDEATNTPVTTLNTDDDNDGVAQLRELLDLMSTDVSGLAKEAASLVKNVLQQEWTSLPEGQRSRHHLWGLEKIVGMHNLLSLSDDDLARFLNCYGPTMLKLIINQTDMSQLSPEELDVIEVGLANDHDATLGGTGNTYARVWGQSPEEMLQLIDDVIDSGTELAHGMRSVLPRIETQSLV
jgi:hypothetical protein